MLSLTTLVRAWLNQSGSRKRPAPRPARNEGTEGAVPADWALPPSFPALREGRNSKRGIIGSLPRVQG